MDGGNLTGSGSGVSGDFRVAGSSEEAKARAAAEIALLSDVLEDDFLYRCVSQLFQTNSLGQAVQYALAGTHRSPSAFTETICRRINQVRQRASLSSQGLQFTDAFVFLGKFYHDHSSKDPDIAVLSSHILPEDRPVFDLAVRLTVSKNGDFVTCTLPRLKALAKILAQRNPACPEGYSYAAKAPSKKIENHAPQQLLTLAYLLDQFGGISQVEQAMIQKPDLVKEAISSHEAEIDHAELAIGDQEAPIKITPLPETVVCLQISFPTRKSVPNQRHDQKQFMQNLQRLLSRFPARAEYVMGAHDRYNLEVFVSDFADEVLLGVCNDDLSVAQRLRRLVTQNTRISEITEKGVLKLSSALFVPEKNVVMLEGQAALDRRAEIDRAGADVIHIPQKQSLAEPRPKPQVSQDQTNLTAQEWGHPHISAAGGLGNPFHAVMHIAQQAREEGWKNMRRNDRDDEDFRTARVLRGLPDTDKDEMRGLTPEKKLELIDKGPERSEKRLKSRRQARAASLSRLAARRLCS